MSLVCLIAGGSPIAARPGCETAAGSCTEGGSHAISSVGQARDEGLPPRAAADSSRGASQGHGFEGNSRHLRPKGDQQVFSHAQQPTEDDANDAEVSKKEKKKKKEEKRSRNFCRRGARLVSEPRLTECTANEMFPQGSAIDIST